MFGLIVIMLAMAVVLGGSYSWARRRGLLAAGHDEGEKQPERRMSLLTEVVGYLGAILLLAGGVAAISRQWSHIGAWAHVGILAGAAAFFLLAGLSVRRVREPAIQRLTGVMWLLSVICTAGAAGYVTYDLIFSFTAADNNAGAVTVLGVGLATAAYAAVLWLIRRRALQAAAMFGGLITLICGVIATATVGRAPNGASLAYALALWGFGLAWAVLGWRRRIEPMWAAMPLGIMLALIAPALGTGRHGWLYVIAIITAGAAMAVSGPLRNTVLLGLGTVAMFGYVTGVVVRYFGQSLGVPAALSIAGALIIVLAVATARLMRAAQPGEPPAPGTEEPDQAPGTAQLTEPRAETLPRRDLPRAS
jgi:hypothetical protein